jgi:hypothetical protein
MSANDSASKAEKCSLVSWAFPFEGLCLLDDEVWRRPSARTATPGTSQGALRVIATASPERVRASAGCESPAIGRGCRPPRF